MRTERLALHFSSSVREQGRVLRESIGIHRATGLYWDGRHLVWENRTNATSHDALALLALHLLDM